MPQLQRSIEELRGQPARQKAVGADVFEDFFTSFFGGPGKPGAAMGIGIPGATNLGLLQGARNLPMVANAPGTGLIGGRAGMLGGNVSLPDVTKIARSIAKKPQDVEDILQTGNLAGTKFIKEKGGTGQDVLYRMRTAMKNWSPGGSMGTGVRKGDREKIERVVAKFGDVGSDKIAAELNKVDPAGKWTIEKVQHARSGQRQVVHLDAPENPVAGGLRSLEDNPEQLAEIKNRLAGLPKGPRKTAEALLKGEPVHDMAKARLKEALESTEKPKGSEWYQRAVAQRKRLLEEQALKRPISGGSTGPEAIPEFPVHAFGPELRRQPAQQFGAEGFRTLSPVDRELAAVNRVLDLQMGELGVGGGASLDPGLTTQSGDLGTTANAYRNLRAIFGQLGRFQGRN